MTSPAAARRRCLAFLAVLQDTSSTGGEKANAASALAGLYREHPALSEMKLDEDDTGGFPPWLQRERLTAVLHRSVRTADQFGMLDYDLPTLLHGVISDWFGPDPDRQPAPPEPEADDGPYSDDG